MKRIKRFFCTFIIVLSIVMLCGCSKDYSSITYNKFVEKMHSELEYSITDNTLVYQNIYQREIEANKDGVLFQYIEFETEEDAKGFVKKNYYNKKHYSYKSTDDYTVVTNSKSGYKKIVQVDNMVIIGTTNSKSYKSDIKKAFKKLGY